MKKQKQKPLVKSAAPSGLPVKTNKRRELKILWHSNSAWSNSGYGTFTAQWAKRIKADGWNIALSTNYGLQGATQDWEGIKVYPMMGDAFGTDSMVAHGNHMNADVVFSMLDVWAFQPQLLQQVRHWIPYTPIDKLPPPSMVLQNLKFAYKILTFAKFGQDALARSGFSSQLILEGTDVNVFKPLNKKQELRKSMNIPQDAFVFGMVAANKENPPRKAFQQVLEAFKLFHDKHPEAALLISCNQGSPQGFPIQAYANYLGFADRVFFPNDYQVTFHGSSEQVNDLYNTFDVYMMPSQTEGFGLTAVEAQSAGIPAIVQDCHSMPELIVDGVTGAKAKTLYSWFTNELTFWNIPDPKSINDKMEEMYKLVKSKPEETQKACHDHIVKNFNIDTIVKEQWIPLLETLQTELIPVKV